MVRPIAVGDMIHGHVAGWFGRDFYECARVEAVGADWVVVRNEQGRAFATSSRPTMVDDFRAQLLYARDRFERGFCDHERPGKENQ